jgi:hypothetical protein
MLIPSDKLLKIPTKLMQIALFKNFVHTIDVFSKGNQANA